jgi:glycosyltransferase involved in cell wall biosynthesis
MYQPVLLLWDPDFHKMVGQFNECMVCYFVDDQYSLFTGAKSTAAEEERPLLTAADLVLCTAETLCDDKRRFNPNVHLVGNGVDYSFFAASTSPQLAVPQDLKDIQRPILGFVGNLNDKVDYDLLAKIAVDNPEWSVILLGPDNVYTPSDRAQFNKLLTYGNVKWLGFRPMQEVPAYLKGMDVCVIPNKVNEYTQYIHPIKLHEYLAAGKPVITTDMPSVRSFGELVRIADSACQWRRHLKETLGEKGPEWIRRRQSVARQNTWEARAEQIHTLLTRTIDNTLLIKTSP